MKFTADIIEINLELTGLPDEEGKKETKIFIPRERPSVDFAESVIKKGNEYVEEQKKLEVKEQDKIFLANMKFLGWVYKDFDYNWVRKNFTPGQVANIREDVANGLMGIKKEEQS